jgi:hypothetical protein
MHPKEVRARAKRALIPGAKTGRRWVFLEADLAECVRSLRETQSRQLGPDVGMHALTSQVPD